jgi:chromosome segregation ATPase
VVDLRGALSSAQSELSASQEHVRRLEADRAQLQQQLIDSREAASSESFDLRRRVQEAEWARSESDRDHQERAHQLQVAVRQLQDEVAEQKNLQQQLQAARAQTEEYLQHVLLVNEQLVGKFAKAVKGESEDGGKKTAKTKKKCGNGSGKLIKAIPTSEYKFFLLSMFQIFTFGILFVSLYFLSIGLDIFSDSQL